MYLLRRLPEVLSDESDLFSSAIHQSAFTKKMHRNQKKRKLTIFYLKHLSDRKDAVPAALCL